VLSAPQRIRTSDLRLRSAQASSEISSAYPPLRPLRDRAVELLRAAHEDGEIPSAEAEALARDWLAFTGADAALQVLTSSAHEAARIIAFLARILELTEAADAADTTAAEGGAR
jgi:hypothetical protein